ncbi:OLC1v1008451C1 [Oldenlandia corymbosa var. corymbosa]|uniref:OLC1v1008451C1 n=1 Tax=Oldenlandia corymbosa var. corymbosa TaxID=529605 RepID=A0AAV1DPW9_OLDCO|nr:OLC1v1008451C1 [Oldenlandia corymbosa var. corymbosa]
MLGSWSIKANAPEDNLWVAISVQHPELGNYFTATLRVKRTSIQIARDPALFFWLMPHRVAIWIYWHVSLLSSSYCGYGGKEFPLSNIQDIIVQIIEKKLYYVTVNFKTKWLLDGMRMAICKLKVVAPPVLLRRVKILAVVFGEMPNGPGVEDECLWVGQLADSRSRDMKWQLSSSWT